MASFQEENNVILNTILDNVFYKPFRQNTSRDHTDDTIFGKAPGEAPEYVEMNITATCNQKCEYCYLTKYGNELYPIELRNEDTIVRNTKLLVDYFVENGYTPAKIDLFAGEIWGTDLADRVLEVIYQAIANEGWYIREIMIPSNMSFLLEDKKRENVEVWIEKFMAVRCGIRFSASFDGLIIDEKSRSFNDEEKNSLRNQEFYDFVFSWCKKYRYAYHPMVSAHAIGEWKDNYIWWQQMFAKYGLNPYDFGMYLEVRNDEWDISSIKKYLEFLNFVIDYDYEYSFNKDFATMSYLTFLTDPDERAYIGTMIQDGGQAFNCTVDKSLIVRMGDLAIGPCHRTHYPQFIYGYYDISSGKITGVKANNIQLAAKVFSNKHLVMPGCENCPILPFCLRQCLGAQYEANHEIFCTCKSVCELYKARLIFLNKKYEELGLYNFVRNSGCVENIELLNNVNHAVDMIKKGEPNLWNYWETIAKEIVSA